MPVSQWTDKATGFDNISIIIHWEDDPSDEYPYQWRFEASFGQFWFLVDKKDDKFSFWLVVDGPRYSSMSGYKSCKVQLLGGKVLGNFPFIYNFFGNYRVDGTVPVNEALTKDREHELSVFFSAEAPVTKATKPPTPAPSLADFMMVSLYQDAASQDVVFVFDTEVVGTVSEAGASSDDKTNQEALTDLHPEDSKSEDHAADKNNSGDNEDLESTNESVDEEEPSNNQKLDDKERSADKESSHNHKASDYILNPDGAKHAENDRQDKAKGAEEERAQEEQLDGSIALATLQEDDRGQRQ
ncbi:hypothetical protein BG000_006160 [Podila horticola]|nr:hypothetical protein BG000_006160 [Podila horticola]